MSNPYGDIADISSISGVSSAFNHIPGVSPANLAAVKRQIPVQNAKKSDLEENKWPIQMYQPHKWTGFVDVEELDLDEDEPSQELH
jgi:hypothetical protein